MIKSIVEIHWKPDKNSSKPAYLQIADYFINRINSGEWPAGSFLPSQRELADRLKVNRSTAVAALEELKAVGLIETNGKGGTRVAARRRSVLNFMQPDWQAFIEDGIHKSNSNTIQIINRHESVNDIIRLSSCEAPPELYPAEAMSKVLADVGGSLHKLGYEEPKGILYLREQICNYLAGFGIKTSPSNVLIVSGAVQAIQLISLGLLQPGSAVFIEKPSYLYSLNIFQSVGIRRCGIPMDHEGIIPEEIPHQKPKHRQSILFTIPNFQSPTSVVMTEQRRKDLLTVCNREQIPIVEDDVYRELWLDNRPPAPIKSMDTTGTTLYVGSVSKTLSAGLRVGWVVGPEVVVDRLSDIKMQADYGTSSLAQHVVGRWMETGLYSEQNERIRKHLRLRRQVAMEALQEYFSDIASWNVPEGGYFVWLEFHCPIRMGALFDEAFKNGILTYPGYLYDSSMNHCLRISYSYAEIEDIRGGIRKLSELARKQIQKKR